MRLLWQVLHLRCGSVLGCLWPTCEFQKNISQVNISNTIQIILTKFVGTAAKLPFIYFIFKHFSVCRIFNFDRFQVLNFEATYLNVFKSNFAVLTGKNSLIIVSESFSFTFNGQNLNVSMNNIHRTILLKYIFEETIIIFIEYTNWSFMYVINLSI